MRLLTINFFGHYEIFSEVMHFRHSSSDVPLLEEYCPLDHPLKKYQNWICVLQHYLLQLQNFNSPKFLVNTCFTVLDCLYMVLRHDFGLREVQGLTCDLLGFDCRDIRNLLEPFDVTRHVGFAIASELVCPFTYLH